MLTLRKVLSLSFLITSTLALPVIREGLCFNEYCQKDERCVISPLTLTVGSCMKLRYLGDTCVPEPREFQLATLYPNRNEITFLDGYWIMPPCAPGLICIHEFGLCAQPIY